MARTPPHSRSSVFTMRLGKMVYPPQGVVGNNEHFGIKVRSSGIRKGASAIGFLFPSTAHCGRANPGPHACQQVNSQSAKIKPPRLPGLEQRHRRSVCTRAMRFGKGLLLGRPWVLHRRHDCYFSVARFFLSFLFFFFSTLG